MFDHIPLWFRPVNHLLVQCIRELLFFEKCVFINSIMLFLLL